MSKEETLKNFKKDIRLLQKYNISGKQMHLLLKECLRKEEEEEKEEFEEIINKYFILNLKAETKILKVSSVLKDEEDIIIIGEEFKVLKNKFNFQITKIKISFKDFQKLEYQELDEEKFQYVRKKISDKLDQISIFFKEIEEKLYG